MVLAEAWGKVLLLWRLAVAGEAAVGVLRHPRGETITVYPFLLDEDNETAWGDRVESFGEPYERHLIAVSPRRSMSNDDGGQGTDASRWPIFEGYDLYDVYDTPVQPYDEIEVRGTRLKIAGEIERWRNPFKSGPDGAVIHAYVSRG